MAYHVGTLVFDDWRSLRLDRGWSDTFVLRVSANSGLPPMDYARVIKRILPPLARLRRGASVWVQVDAPGRWYVNELRRAIGHTPCPVAVTNGMTLPDAAQFSYIVRQGNTPVSPPPKIIRSSKIPASPEISASQLRVLQVLARIQGGTALDVGALADVTEKTALTALRTLVGRKLAEYVDHPPRKRENEQIHRRKKQLREARRRHRWYRQSGTLKQTVLHRKAGILNTATLPLLLAHLQKIHKKQFRSQPKHWWRITRQGKSLALRSWGIPAGVSFQAGMERDYLPGWRHVRTSRLALEWVRRAGQSEVLGGWSEVSVPGYRVVPDALLWANVQGDETIFWVEVQGGSKPKQLNAFLRRMRLRFKRATEYARFHKVHLVFLVLGKPWAVQLLRTQFSEIRSSEAVLLQTWMQFGELPRVIWGALQSGGKF